MKKVPILADGMNWTWQFDGFSYTIPSEIERIMVYSLYIGHSDWDFVKVAKQYLPDGVVDNTNLKLLRSSFKDLHPFSDIQEYDIGMVPEYADPTMGLWLYGDRKNYNIVITLDDEKELLSRLKNTTPWKNCMSLLKNSVILRYTISFDDSIIESALVSFLIQHGIDPVTVIQKDEQYYKSNIEEWRKKIEDKQLNNPSYSAKSILDNEKTELKKRKVKQFTKRMIPAAIIYPILMAITAFLWVITLNGSNYESDIGWFLLAFLFGIGGVAFRDESGIFMIKGWYVSLILFYVGCIIASITGIVLEGAGELVSYVALILSLAYAIALLGFQTDGRHLFFFDEHSARWRRLNGRG